MLAKKYWLWLLPFLSLAGPSCTFGGQNPIWVLLSPAQDAWTDSWLDLGHSVDVETIAINVAGRNAPELVTRLADRGDRPLYVIARGPAVDTAMDLTATGTLEIDGVISISGAVHDLASASPSPPMLLLTAALDRPGVSIAARRFEKQALAAGTKVRWRLVPGMNHENLPHIHPGHPAYGLVLDFLNVKTMEEAQQTRSQPFDAWRRPPMSNDSLWMLRDLVRTFPANERFRHELQGFFRNQLYRLSAWPLRHFRAIPLRDYVVRRWPDREHPWLRTISRAGEVSYWDLEQIYPYQPLIVLGIDDDTNLFGWVQFYQTLAEASWVEGGDVPPVAVRPLGAFLYFPKAPPAAWDLPLNLRSMLFAEGFELLDEDPLSALSGTPEDVLEVLTGGNRCIHCHRFNGIGGSAHHLNARTARPQGGYALPLENYTSEVMKSFVYFNQNVARKIGVTPNQIPVAVQQAFLEFLSDAKANALVGSETPEAHNPQKAEPED